MERSLKLFKSHVFDEVHSFSLEERTSHYNELIQDITSLPVSRQACNDLEQILSKVSTVEVRTNNYIINNYIWMIWCFDVLKNFLPKKSMQKICVEEEVWAKQKQTNKKTNTNCHHCFWVYCGFFNGKTIKLKNLMGRRISLKVWTIN